MARVFGPDNATLTVRTKRTGAASKAGHDLLIEVGSWSATLDPDADPALTLTADSRSLRVLEGTGGIQALDDEAKAGIAQTIDEEVLQGGSIAFRSRQVTPRPDGLDVEGELELRGVTRPLSFGLALDDRHLTGSARFKQSAWQMTPYSALFGTLKVADDVEVTIDATLPRSTNDG
jgi:YceI-like protein